MVRGRPLPLYPLLGTKFQIVYNERVLGGSLDSAP